MEVTRMNLRNNTVIDENVYTDFQLFRKQLIKRSRPLTIAVFSILIAAVLAMLVYSFIVLNLYYIIGSGIFAFLLYKEIRKVYLKPKKMYQKKGIKPVTVRYLFQTNSYKILEEGRSEADVPPVKYSQILKAYETPKYFYLFFNKNLANIVAKEAFEEKACQHFSDKLKEHLGKSYIKCN